MKEVHPRVIDPTSFLFLLFIRLYEVVGSLQSTRARKMDEGMRVGFRGLDLFAFEVRSVSLQFFTNECCYVILFL